MLLPGTRVDLDLLGPARVTRLLGSGGQGDVYEIERGDSRLALKWYKPTCATIEQRRALEMLVSQGSPHPRFLWPLSLAHSQAEQGLFGYVMPLRDQRFVEMGHFISGRDGDGNPVDMSYAAVIRMCRLLADSFLRLHSRGLCYRDISFGNVFIEPSDGDVRICDNDNVGVDNGDARVLGTPFFMAPEIVVDTTFRTLPSTQSDLHSLAVLLFYALFVGHPLEGRRTDAGLRDEAWLFRHFGSEPMFCFDPEDDSNRPSSDHVRAYWETYPATVRRYFIRAFTEGLREPWARVTESEWIKVMDRLRDSMVSCANCSNTSFYDREEPGKACSRCQHPVQPPFFLQVGRHQLPVGVFTELRSDHMGGRNESETAVGRAVRHPSDPTRWGLHNMSHQTWYAKLADGRTAQVEPDRIIGLDTELSIELGVGRVVVKQGGSSSGTVIRS